MKQVVVPVPDLPNDKVDGVASTLVDMGFDPATWNEEAAPLHPNARRNLEQLRRYGVEFTDIRRFELAVPEDMDLKWVVKLVEHALRDNGVEVDVGKPIALE